MPSEGEGMLEELEQDFADFITRLTKLGITEPYNHHDMRACYMQGLMKGMKIS